jgi:uncharacterized protein YheU (UPF0270 family)
MSHHRYESGVIVPHGQLSRDALKGLLEEFVSRDGTDSGYIALSLNQRVDQVRRQLDRGEVVVVFDEATQSANIVAFKEVKGAAVD